MNKLTKAFRATVKKVDGDKGLATLDEQWDGGEKFKKLHNYMWKTHEHYLEALFPNRQMNIGWGSGNTFIETKVYAEGDEPAMVVETIMQHTPRMTKEGKGVTILHRSRPYKK